MTTNKQIIDNVAGENGIPAYIMEDTAYLESSYNSNTDIIDSNGQHSTGLFQLNQAGLGAGYTISELQDPTLNATIAAQAMQPWVQKAQANGLSGLAEMEFVDNNAGWPGELGVANTQSIEPSYDQKLAQIYAKGAPDTGASSSTTSSGGVLTSGPNPYSGIAGAIYSLYQWEHPSPSTKVGKLVNDVIPYENANEVWHRAAIVIFGFLILMLGIAGFAMSHSSEIAPIVMAAL